MWLDIIIWLIILKVFFYFDIFDLIFCIIDDIVLNIKEYRLRRKIRKIT